jgi:RimJ/RimL family protein N-acetyltransferase
MESSFIDGTIVTLRPLSLEDINDMYVSWFNDAEVCKYNSHHVYPYTIELAKEYVTKIRSEKRDLVLAIIAKDTGKHIGNISLQNIHPIDRSAEYAVILGDRDYWGKGVAGEASRLIIQHGFSTMNLHRIYCGTSTENVPMQKLAAKLGFREEGRRKEAMYKNGAFVDVIEYGLLRSDIKAA